MREEINEHADRWREDRQTGAMTLELKGWRAVTAPDGAAWVAYIEPASAEVEGERSEPERLDSRARARAWCEMALARVTAPVVDGDGQ
jgi:hypothetical protein